MCCAFNSRADLAPSEYAGQQFNLQCKLSMILQVFRLFVGWSVRQSVFLSSEILHQGTEEESNHKQNQYLPMFTELESSCFECNKQ